MSRELINLQARHGELQRAHAKLSVEYREAVDLRNQYQKERDVLRSEQSATVAELTLALAQKETVEHELEDLKEKLRVFLTDTDIEGQIRREERLDDFAQITGVQKVANFYTRA